MKYRIAFNRTRFDAKPGREIDWEAFNSNFKNVELEIPEICNAIYRGHAYTAWMNGKRNKQNFICAQHLAVDMDTQDYRSSMDALCEHPLVRQYGAIIHTTPTHTSEAPKARCIFLMDAPIESVEGYELAQDAIYSLFDGADRACIDASRFFFGNGRLKLENRPEEIWFPDEVCFPLADMRLFAQQHLQNKRKLREEQFACQERRISVPSQRLDLDKIAERLERIDPYSMDYKLWFKTISGLKHEFGDQAFHVAKRWSDRPDKEELTERKWQTIGTHSKPATIATVYKVISEYGG